MQSNWHLRRLRITDIAVLITSIVLLSFGITLNIISTQDKSFTEIFTPEHVQMLNMYDTTAQRTAHRVGLVVLAVLAVISFFLIYRRNSLLAARPARIAGSAANLLKRYSGIFVCAAAAIFLFSVFQAENWLRGVIIIRLGEIILSVFIIFSLIVYYRSAASRKLKSPVVHIIVWTLLIFYIIWLIVPGFIQPLFFFAQSQIWVEGHYNVTLAQGDRLAAGLQIANEVNLNYGLIPSLLLAIFERNVGFLDFGGHFKVVQITQVLFLLTAVVTFYLWKPLNPLFTLFATLLLGTWVSTAHSAIYFPNQSGWRFLGLAIGVLCLLLVRRQTLEKASFILGLSTGFLILFNTETGICLTFGYLVFLLSRLRTLNIVAIVFLAIRFVIGAVAAGLSVILLYRIGLGEFPNISITSFFGFIGRFGQGYSGLPLQFDPLALIIYVGSIFVVALIGMRWWKRELKVNESVRLALGSVILIWLSYYINRPDPWNLWTFEFLFMFLIADLLNPLFFAHRRHKIWSYITDGRLAVIVFLLLPFIINQNYLHIRTVLDQRFLHSGQTIKTVSGVPMSERSADALLTKAAYLERCDPQTTLYFTHNSYSLSLMTKRFIKLPVQDAFGETITKQDFENLIDGIKNNPPKLLLFDEYDDLGIQQDEELKYYDSFFERIKNRLSEKYHIKETANGWEVWELNPS